MLAIYLRLVGRQLLLVLIAIGYGLTAGLQYLRFDPLLTFLIAGFVVTNLSRQGEKLLTGIEQTSALVFVVFFAAAGAHLDLPLLSETLADRAQPVCHPRDQYLLCTSDQHQARQGRADRSALWLVGPGFLKPGSPSDFRW